MADRATLNNREPVGATDEPQAFPARRDAANRTPRCGDIAHEGPDRRADRPAIVKIDSGTAPSPRNETILVDQAVFTSVRGPVAEGYRIVAATANVTPAERAEITRRSPSHGSLSDDQPLATALSAYPLDSGRYCVAVSRPAGIEHTGRGGQRVCTHIAVLDDDAFRAFACNPAAVHAALCQADGPKETAPTPPRLGPLRLSAPPPIVSGSQGGIGTDWLLCLTRAVLRSERLIVAGATEETAALNALVVSLPLALRRELSVSCGLRYAASRRLQLNFVGRDNGDLQRAVRGQPIQLYDIASTPESDRAPYDDWLCLLGRWFKEGRTAEIASLTATLTGEVSPVALNCIARIWTHVDAAGERDGRTADAIGGFMRTGPPMP